jgi:hypothetical protein
MQGSAVERIIDPAADPEPAPAPGAPEAIAGEGGHDPAAGWGSRRTWIAWIIYLAVLAAVAVMGPGAL